MVGVGKGIQQQVSGQLAKLGKDLITIQPGAPNSKDFLGLAQSGPSGVLTAKDVTAAHKSSHVASITPIALVDGTVSVGKGSNFRGHVIGTAPNFADVVHQPLAYGSFFGNDEDQAQMAVVGSDVAASLFQENVPLGRAFTFRGQTFVVVGILKPFETVPLSSALDFNDAIFIRYDTAQKLTQNTSPVYEMLARPADAKQIDAAVSSLKNNLLQLHGGQQTFSVLKQGQSLQVTNGILSLVSKLVLAAAITALFVGSIGIMNIMFVSVTERMREIGIRKAIGATNRQILGQFLMEALMLSLFGWIIGAICASFAIWMIRLFSTLEPIFPWLMYALSFVVAIGSGILFGAVPALKAALKDPIDALRNE
jgi:putative ABC transport system permease protein